MRASQRGTRDNVGGGLDGGGGRVADGCTKVNRAITIRNVDGSGGGSVGAVGRQFAVDLFYDGLELD